MGLYYSYSCGYRKVFEDYSGIIHQKYPEISVIGTNYDPPGLNMYLSRLIVSKNCVMYNEFIAIKIY